MSLKARIKRLETKKTPLNKSDQDFISNYDNLENPSKKEEDRRMIIDLILYKFEDVVGASFEPVKQELSGE